MTDPATIFKALNDLVKKIREKDEGKRPTYIYFDRRYVDEEKIKEAIKNTCKNLKHTLR